MRKTAAPPKNTDGMALLPVLIIMGMITVIVLLLFNLSNTLLRTSSSQSASYQTTVLRDTAINMAIAQLRQGSTEQVTMNDAIKSKANALWISQPGALRTYQPDTAAPLNVYKLYSNQEMIVSASTLSTSSQKNLEDDVPSDAPSKSDVFANLNLPSIDGVGKMYFPIIDPRSMDAATPTYPGSATPEGFSYSNNQAVSGVFTNGTYIPSNKYGVNGQRLAMHVQWIYLLADGSMGVIDKTTRIFVPFSGQNNASATNPMIGRFAFWTDDESCKINVNTASEGIFWDTPRCATNQEIAFAKQPPINGEVQRYGGHPATTCLSTFFYPGERLLPSTNASELKMIYDMTPRVNYKDKDGNPTGAFRPVPMAATTVNPVVPPTPLRRLYASVDDFALTPDRKEQPIFTAKPYLRDRMRFFLTAESRAPELTASGHPRVAVWPATYYFTTPTYCTVFDNLVHFCSTLGQAPVGTPGNTPYYFRRVAAYSVIGDYVNGGGNGGGGPGTSASYPLASTDPLKIGPVCNANLTLYLIELAKLTKQGYPKSFAEKYDLRTATPGSPITKLYNTSTGLLDCMEYVRQTNMTDTTTSTDTSGSRVIPYAAAFGELSGTVLAQHDYGYAAPLNGTNMLKNPTDQVITNGIARAYTISEFGLVLLVAAEHKLDGTKINAALVDSIPVPIGFKAIQIAPLFEGFCAGQGYSTVAPTASTTCSFLSSLVLKLSTGATVSASSANWGRWNPTVDYLGYMTASKAPYQTDPNPLINSGAQWWVSWGGSGGRWMFEDDNNTPADTPYYSRGYFIIPSTETQVTLQNTRTGVGVARCLELAYSRWRAIDYNKHRLFIEVPDTIIPVPQAPDSAAMQVAFDKRLANARLNNRYQSPEVIDKNDVVRTWVVRHGDHRLTFVRMNEGNANLNTATGFTDINQRLFVPHPGWDSTDPLNPNYIASQNIKQIHSFTKSGGVPEKISHIDPSDIADPSDATFQRGLVKNVTYGENVRPDFTIDPDADKSQFRKNVDTLNTRLLGVPVYPYSVDPSDTRDWDNGTGIAPDGAYWNKADDVAKVWDGAIPPYFSKRVWDGGTPDAVNQTCAPNQLMPSAVMFGSLNSAASAGLQWTTYLFRPDITPGGHLGAKDHSTMGTLTGAPPDHIMLDWFWMPVVQPYAISEPFSTAGKINMNYRIAPFTHIKRATGMHAVLKSEQILAIPTTAGLTYKDFAKAGNNGNWRHYLDAAKTLLQWEEKFNNGDFFKNASEVCEQFLVPESSGISATTATTVRTQMTTYWNQNQLSGDNTLERPYANIYPRLTTRSNTYRVHFLVQTITKARSTDPTKFTNGKDTISGESQGDALVERAIDPNDPALSQSTNANYPSYNYIKPSANGATGTIDFKTNTKSLDNLFSWRIRNIHRFSK